jgi:hypothetical protein
MRAHLLAVLLLSSLAGCTASLSGQTIQPNPLAMPPEETLRQSASVRIRVRDMEVPEPTHLNPNRGVVIYDTAYFTVVSPERLRFHVELVHKWEEMVDVRGWRATLEDDRGNVWRPDSAEKGRMKFTATTWDEDHPTAVRNILGTRVGTRRDAHLRREALENVDLFRGRGDLVFSAPGLFDRDVRRLTLVLERGGVRLRFTWHMFDPEDSRELDDGVEPETPAQVGQGRAPAGRPPG